MSGLLWHFYMHSNIGTPQGGLVQMVMDRAFTQFPACKHLPSSCPAYLSLSQNFGYKKRMSVFAINITCLQPATASYEFHVAGPPFYSTFQGGWLPKKFTTSLAPKAETPCVLSLYIYIRCYHLRLEGGVGECDG